MAGGCSWQGACMGHVGHVWQGGLHGQTDSMAIIQMHYDSLT